MKVDYGWISALLSNGVSFTYYDVNNVARALTDVFSIKFIDIKFNTNRVMDNPWFIIGNAPSSPNPGYFTFATSENGSYSSQLSVDLTSIPAGGTLRLWVRCADSGTVDLRVYAKIRLTPGGDWQPPYWESGQFSYLMSKAVKTVSFQQYDENGTAKAATNDFQIGSSNINVQTDRAVSNAVITIADLSGSQSNGGMLYSLSPSGPWSASLQYNQSLNDGDNVRRIYTKPSTFTTGGRVQSRMNVSVAWSGVSIVVADAYQGYQTRVYSDRLMIRLNAVPEHWYGAVVNLSNGDVSPYLSVAGDNILKSVSEYVTNEVWSANIETHNAHENYDVLQSWTHNFPGIKVPGLRYARSASARVVKVSGRDDPPTIVTQPSVANGWLLKFEGLDDISGEAEYVIDLYVTINW